MIMKENIFQKDAEKIKTLLNELRPEWNVKILEGDYNLYKLGFVKDVPSTVSIEASEEDVAQLLEELYDMETDAYIDEELLEVPSSKLSEKEKARKHIAQESLNRYNRYSWLETVLR